MSNNKLSSIDILCGKLAMKLGMPQAITFYIDNQEEIAEAKAMHKEEIMNASEAGFDDGSGFIEDIKYKNPEQYYKKTYGGNK